MSRNKLAYAIHKEIASLNERIDRNIVLGRSYVREASRHKALLRQLRHLNQYQQRSGVFNMFSFR
ncbi:MAG: hypothetical protein Q8R30_03715 [bacterium]|nr:hypothetical protein [bacterium]MDZ4285672.1 hypothetical protein [Candidatus Sungbacteria bacterium]